MNKLIRIIPLVLVLVLGVVLYQGLSLNPRELPSALVGKPMPKFNLTQLKQADNWLSNDDLHGQIVLLNVWATWCPTCNYEHPFLMRLAKDPRLALYGINYNDDRQAAIQYLDQYQDPFRFSLFDDQGKLGLDLGIYGAPETFVVDSRGIIRKRFAGALDGNVWAREFEPLIQQLIQEQAQLAGGGQ